MEADKTNEFLQAIGKAIERKIDSTEAVAAVKNGVSPESTKPAKAAGKTKTEKSKEPAPAGSSTKKPSNDSNRKTEGKTKAEGKAKAGSKVDAKSSTENKKAKPKVTKQSSISKENGQTKAKKIEEPAKHEEKPSVEPVNDVNDDKKEELAVSRQTRESNVRLFQPAFFCYHIRSLFSLFQWSIITHLTP